jgi:hypothetical protein
MVNLPFLVQDPISDGNIHQAKFLNPAEKGAGTGREYTEHPFP